MPDGSGVLFQRDLTRKQKAALIVQLLITDGQRMALSQLPDEVQLELTRQLAALGIVDRVTMDAVIDEFVTELDAMGLSGPQGMGAALTTLSSHLSPSAASRIKEELSGGDPWPVIAALPEHDLARIMQREAVEVGAITLSKLPIPKAAEVLGLIHGSLARRITYAMSFTADVHVDTVNDIGRALLMDYGATEVPVFKAPAPTRLGEILTASRSGTRDAVLQELRQEDEAFASEVRRAIFTFSDIPARIAPPDMPKLAKAMAQPDLVRALAAAGDAQEVTDYILGNMSKRMAAQLSEEIAELPPMSAAEAEDAQNLMMTALRELVERGEVTLIHRMEEA
ncbi:flagellar motor switch protein FliG [Marivivens donghaensis]|uniref:Flagellar motor switch protein FliG n=1 Tax=Marivivens donghaensis TaxID=1699413 RepID=A0ABX0VY46_9RHOB|nr:FliG C-terminal domain-containing protein [Marivivens donghaensis]NIY72633.1 flagellar motor switch protein FliG [Marivivens donghaensis]